MMDEVLDALLDRLGGEPADRFQVLGVTPEGKELHAGLHMDDATPSAAECVSVYVEVPEAPAGRLFVVLCRWRDTKDTVAYSSLCDGAEMPEWKTLELLPEGVRLSVKWAGEQAPRVYDFVWKESLHPVESR